MNNRQGSYWEKFRNNRKMRQRAQILLDVSISLVSFYFFLQEASFLGENAQFNNSVVVLCSIPFLHVLANSVLGSYKQLWRYFSFREIQNLALNTISVGTVLILMKTIFNFSITVDAILTEASVFFLLAIFVRALRKTYSNITIKRNNTSFVNFSKKRTLIIGAGIAADRFIKSMKDEKAPLSFIACVDDDIKKIGAEINEVPILDSTKNINDVINKLNIQLVIIATPSASSYQIQCWLSEVRKSQVKVKVLPGTTLFVSSKQMSPMYNFTLDDLIDAKEFQSSEEYKPSRSKSSKETVLVTGGVGYIGLHLIEKLLKDDREIKILDNFSFGKTFLPDYLSHPNIEVFNGDISNIKDVVKSVKQIDSIIALAAIVGDPACSISPEETLNLNYEASKILVETANFYGVKRLVFASSCSVYGASDSEYLTEESTLNPVSLYAKTRIMSEDVLFDRCGNVEPVVLRLATVFGHSPRMRFDLVVNLLTIKALIEKEYFVFGPSQWRPFIHCKDVAEAFYLASKADSDIVNGEVFNVGNTKHNYTLGDVGDIIKELIPDANYGIKTDVTDLRNYKVDFTKIEEKLKFKISINIKQGVQELIEQYTLNETYKNYKDHIFSNYENLKMNFKQF